MSGQDKMPPAPRAAFHRDGSISDTTYQRTSVEHSELIETRLIEERLRNWKKSNKIITHIRENPFNMHLECLDQIEMRSASDKREVEAGNNGAEMRQQNCPNQLSQLYSKNNPNNDFRTLLYNIICCLLIQDEQVLSTPSVTKMIDAIRAHLESASKFYASAMASLNGASSGSSSADNKSHLLAQQTASQEEDSRRKSSLGSLSCVSSAGSSWSNVPGSVQTQMGSSQTTSTSGQSSVSAISTIWSMCKSDLERAQSNSVQTVKDSRRNQKLANLRRVSSVSYNDEQLINDLCQMEEPAEGGGSSTGPNGAFRTDSPWRYEELSSECRHHPDQTYHHRTSQSSLENNSITTANLIEQTNDSGVGTIYDFQADEFQFRGGQKKRNSDYQLRQQVVDFKPKQQPSYMSTDDYVSSTMTTTTSRSIAENRTELYDDEQSSSLPRRDLKEPRQVDVASRRAELEWTLNKLINFELKYAWLTSKDTLRRAIRKIGVPNEIRSKVWLILIEQAVGSSYNIGQLLEAADKTISGFKDNDCLPTAADDEEMDAILKQIELDVNRTMPGHKLFDEGAEGGIKLRRILVAYSIHINRAIAYCQGFNFIVALLLSVFEGDQHKALSGFVCIVDHIFPSKFYFDHYLTGARADQFLLADFICDQLIKNPSTAERKMVEGVTSSITLNWFISLFHGAVPTLTRLTILDHFMLDGVKALFRFTMAILYLAFQVTPPSSCEVFTTIRNTARDMYDIKLLLSIVDQIKLPKDSYFAIRRSFYMVQSSFNSDQFYMQSLSNDASRQLVTNKPLSVQQLPDTKQPAMSLITAASLVAHQSFGITGDYQNFANHSQSVGGPFGPRVCTSSDRTKVCIQNIGKLGRSHIKIMDANIRSNERSLMSPLRNCLVIGVSNCGRKVILARQSSRRNFKTFREQDLTFHVHELCTEIFDGFYLEDIHLALIVTHVGEVFKIDVSRCFADSQSGSTETLMLRENRSIEDHEKVKLRMVSMDVLTNLLWVYVECDDLKPEPILHRQKRINSGDYTLNGDTEKLNDTMAGAKKKYRSNNPFLCDVKDEFRGNFEPQRQNFQRKIIIVDIVSFDVFSAFSIHQNFGDILNMRTSLIAFCQLANPMSNQFSSRIVRIGPTGRYEHLLSFSDVVDFMIDASSNCQKKPSVTNESKDGSNQRYSTFKSLIRSISLNQDNDLVSETAKSRTVGARPANSGTLTRYYRSLIKSYSTVIDSTSINESIFIKRDEKHQVRAEPSNYFFPESPNKAILASQLNDSGDSIEADYMPVIMVFIFRNGKIALFEFTESYAIHTRESQLDRYDYSKVIGISKSGEDFIITILTIFDKLIKVVI